MPKPVFAIDKITFQLDVQNDFNLYGFNLKPAGDVPDVVKMRSKRHYWKNPTVIDDGTSTNTVLHLRAKPKVKNASAAALAAAKAAGAGYDGDDDLTITLTWNEGTGDEQTEEVTVGDVEFTP